MSILITTVRIAGFRGLENVEVELEKTTVLTGMNNTGKTSFLKALQLVFGNRQFISQDDFFIHANKTAHKIIVDLLIIPVDDEGTQVESFSEKWEILFTTKRIQNDGRNSFVPVRTIISFDKIKNSYKTEQYILKTWADFCQKSKNWHESDNGNRVSFNFDELPFYYMDGNRSTNPIFTIPS